MNSVAYPFKLCNEFVVFAHPHIFIAFSLDFCLYHQSPFIMNDLIVLYSLRTFVISTLSYTASMKH